MRTKKYKRKYKSKKKGGGRFRAPRIPGNNRNRTTHKKSITKSRNNNIVRKVTDPEIYRLYSIEDVNRINLNHIIDSLMKRLEIEYGLIDNKRNSRHLRNMQLTVGGNTINKGFYITSGTGFRDNNKTTLLHILQRFTLVPYYGTVRGQLIKAMTPAYVQIPGGKQLSPRYLRYWHFYIMYSLLIYYERYLNNTTFIKFEIIYKSISELFNCPEELYVSVNYSIHGFPSIWERCNIPDLKQTLSNIILELLNITGDKIYFTPLNDVTINRQIVRHAEENRQPVLLNFIRMNMELNSMIVDKRVRTDYLRQLLENIKTITIRSIREVENFIDVNRFV